MMPLVGDTKPITTGAFGTDIVVGDRLMDVKTTGTDPMRVKHCKKPSRDATQDEIRRAHQDKMAQKGKGTIRKKHNRVPR
jgi:hypothetical protein